ncbi:testosterone 17-beta-dehydrogenase 3 isoform X2 [Bufo gargarizans]|uniref:testosterone 17-beta-dehydrogenase 3 isoform X2 n=1 Tax=Bufo gargarizans TaxID=30331 RepID=UPI001CF1E283|nr:testosterone 17-beta-dehydrogenase 3 isoform X2 [Bufo gargarizans]
MELLLQQFFSALGLILCFQFILKCFGFSKYLFPRLWGVLPPSFLQTMGEWAVVTGAGDGIGKAYSVELANRGMNIVMISRTLDKMQKVALEIVNNVGMLHSPDPCRFLAAPDNDENLINCNVFSAVKMTRLVLKQMEQRRKGLILNISSAIGSFPCPLYTIYSASKAFVTTFSKALQAEYKSKGIIIQAVTPYGVSTPMTKNMSTNLITKSSEDFVRESLNHVTHGSETFGCLAHAVLGGIMNQVPLWVIHSTRVQEYFLTTLMLRKSKENKNLSWLPILGYLAYRHWGGGGIY